MGRTHFQQCIFLLAAGITACATSPLGRDQLILFPDDQVAQMGVTAYQELKNSTPVTSDSDASKYVSCVADALTRALPDGASTQQGQWEVTVFAEDQINAFALPGGKIGVYQGLLSVAENQDQLATVIAHEIAHVPSRHSNERISTQYATSTGLELASVLAGQASPAKQTLLGLQELHVGQAGCAPLGAEIRCHHRPQGAREGVNSTGTLIACMSEGGRILQTT